MFYRAYVLANWAGNTFNIMSSWTHYFVQLYFWSSNSKVHRYYVFNMKFLAVSQQRFLKFPLPTTIKTSVGIVKIANMTRELKPLQPGAQTEQRLHTAGSLISSSYFLRGKSMRQGTVVEPISATLCIAFCTQREVDLEGHARVLRVTLEQTLYSIDSIHQGPL